MISPAQPAPHGDLPEIMESFVIENEPQAARELIGRM